MRKHNFDELFGIRHAKSDANLAVELSHAGDDSLIHALKTLHTSEVPLCREGECQVEMLRTWWKHMRLPTPDSAFVSRYLRAEQTLVHSGIAPFWTRHETWNERDWGHIDHVTHTEREVLAPGWKAKKEANPFSWRPLGGETLGEKQAQVALHLEELSAHTEGKVVCITSHGETLYGGLRPVMEGISEVQFARHERSMRMGNCDIVHYRYRGNDLYVRLLSPLNNNIGEWRLVT